MIGLNWSNDPFVMKMYNYNLSLNLRNYLCNVHILWKDCKKFLFLYISVICNQGIVAIWSCDSAQSDVFASLFLQTKVGSC